MVSVKMQLHILSTFKKKNKNMQHVKLKKFPTVASMSWRVLFKLAMVLTHLAHYPLHIHTGLMNLKSTLTQISQLATV